MSSDAATDDGSASEMKPRVALCMFGLSHRMTYRHWIGVNYDISWKLSVDNYLTMILSPLRERYEVDIFFVTEEHDKMDELLIDYPATDHAVLAAHTGDHNIGRNLNIKRLLELVSHHQTSMDQTYTMVIMTRFDLKWKIPITQLPYDLTSFNISGRLHKGRIDDNLYIFSGTNVDKLLQIVNDHLHNTAHNLEQLFIAAFGSIKFLCETDPYHHLFDFVRRRSIDQSNHKIWPPK